jgi:hypothetical protein
MIDIHSYGCHNHGANLLPIPEPTWALINPPRYLHNDHNDDDNDENDDEDDLHVDDNDGNDDDEDYMENMEKYVENEIKDESDDEDNEDGVDFHNNDDAMIATMMAKTMTMMTMWKMR